MRRHSGGIRTASVSRFILCVSIGFQSELLALSRGFNERSLYGAYALGGLETVLPR